MKNIEHIDDLTLAETNKILIARAKKSELNYEQKLSKEHAKYFSKLSPKKSEDMKKELLEKAEVTNEVACKIVDILPNKIQLDLIAEKNKCINNTNKETILEIVEKYKK
jgi:DNA-directed RNA polymerase subunit F